MSTTPASTTPSAASSALADDTNSSTTDQTFNAQNQATGTGAHLFDANGNTISGAGQTSVYDAWNRLVTVKDSGGETVASYAYDALGRRITETDSGSSTTKTRSRTSTTAWASSWGTEPVEGLAESRRVRRAPRGRNWRFEGRFGRTCRCRLGAGRGRWGGSRPCVGGAWRADSGRVSLGLAHRR